MGRPVRIRVSYTNDANYLVRLIESIEKDTRDSDFRAQIIPLLQKAAGLLIIGPKTVQEKSG